MARRTRRKSRKSKSSRRRQRGGAGVAQHAGDFGPAEPVVQEGENVEEGMGHADNEQKGGKRKRKGKATKKGKKKGNNNTRKRKLNPFFKLMLDAKEKLASFKYNGKTYRAESTSA